MFKPTPKVLKKRFAKMCILVFKISHLHIPECKVCPMALGGLFLHGVWFQEVLKDQSRTAFAASLEAL